MTPTLFGLPNNTATEVKPCEPWTFEPNVPPEVRETKEKFAAWRLRSDSQHLVFSATEGVNIGLRTGKNNVVRRLHGIIADFDSDIAGGMATPEKIRERFSEGMRPTWVAKTFSGGLRLVWMFDEPQPMEFEPLTKQFLIIAHTFLNLEKAIPGLDTGAFHDLTKFYDVGFDWQRVDDIALSNGVVESWLIRAMKKLDWDATDEIQIPIEDVAAEVERQFPGRWEGEFEVGRRGVCFFDPNSTNDSSSIVGDGGMFCFSQAQRFHPWSKILGGSFVRQYQEDRLGAAIKNIYWTGRTYFSKDPLTSVYKTQNVDSIKRYLTSKRKIKDTRTKKQTSSELTDALSNIESLHRVDGAFPAIFSSDESVIWNGKKYLNTSMVRALRPVSEPQEWGVNFPWLAEFLRARFLPDVWEYEIAWTQRVYAGALSGVPAAVQASFLVGGTNLGKTLYSNKIIGGLLGGFADATSYLTQGSQFNKELSEYGLWTVDDGQAAKDPASHRMFSEKVKAFVANPTLVLRAMYMDPLTIPFLGALILTLNDDQLCLRLIPDLAISMAEKVTVKRMHDGPFKFLQKEVQEAIILRELPYYGRYVLDYKVKPHVLGDPRFGILPYIDEDIRSRALFAGGAADLLELVDLWDDRAFPRERFGDVWRGTSSNFYTMISSDDVLKPLIMKFSLRALTQKFLEASQVQGSKITIVENKIDGRGNVYQIALNKDDRREGGKSNKYKIEPEA